MRTCIFNRYRTLSLATPWIAHLPWSTLYGDYATAMEGMCLRAGRHGGKWVNSSDSMFGGSDEEGVLGPQGPSRWKQRALYDAIKDSYALHSLEVSLARVSIHDESGGVKRQLGDEERHPAGAGGTEGLHYGQDRAPR
ncbi:hypothetical protein ACFVTM_08825 [Arthrobacter sp. NPDC058130]|uniref:DUF7255 family protein n=1 Tax=Arthrobacter sp. NPDC058130 TaxID=3346353 RepID=UPI0036EB03DA